MMPGIDGYLATKNIPIIMVTALNNRDAKMQALSAGAEDFLTKPIDRAELCMRVRNSSRLKAYGDYFEQQTGAQDEFSRWARATEPPWRTTTPRPDGSRTTVSRSSSAIRRTPQTDRLVASPMEAGLGGVRRQTPRGSLGHTSTLELQHGQ